MLLFVHLASGFPESLSSVVPLRNQTLMWPAIIATLSLLTWFLYYRHGEGHATAFLFGIILLTPLVGALISESVNDVKYFALEKNYLAYVGLSHLFYGWTNWREVLSVLGSHE